MAEHVMMIYMCFGLALIAFAFAHGGNPDDENWVWARKLRQDAGAVAFWFLIVLATLVFITTWPAWLAKPIVKSVFARIKR